MAVKIPIRNAVLHRNNDGVGSEQFRHFAGHRLDLMRLHRQNDDILRAGGRVVIGRLDRGNGFLLPSAVISRMPRLRSASRFAPRAMKVTSSPASASLIPT